MSPQLCIFRVPVYRRWLAVFPVMSAFALAGPGAGQALAQWEQIHKLTANDAAPGDVFGVSVSISGVIAVVGARSNDDAGSRTGSAYLFNVATGEQLHKLTADDAAEGDHFGTSAAISGDVAIIGASGDDDAGESSGAAYLFDVATGEQLHKLTATDAAAFDFSGWSVAISGGIAIVGAYRPADNASSSAYLFDVTTGQQLHKLTPDDPGAGSFGWSVALSGSIAIVGRPFDNGTAGSAYLFDATTGQQLYKLAADDAAEGDSFGSRVAISGGIAIVGAVGDDDACPADPQCKSGSAYLFDVATGAQLHKLTADDAEAGDFFASVAISGGIAIVGAQRDDDTCPGNADCDSGSAYVLDVATGAQLHKLTAADAAAGDLFGAYVAVSGGVAIVGASRNDDACPEYPLCSSGSAYVFGQSAPCSEDLDGDGLVGPFDLATVLGNWGPCPDPCQPGNPTDTCPADLDGD